MSMEMVCAYVIYSLMIVLVSNSYTPPEMEGSSVL